MPQRAATEANGTTDDRQAAIPTLVLIGHRRGAGADHRRAATALRPGSRGRHRDPARHHARALRPQPRASELHRHRPVRLRPHVSDVPGRHGARPGDDAPGAPGTGRRVLGRLARRSRWASALVLHGTGLVLDHVVVALCLTTTALGTLLPILRDAGVLQTSFGPSILSVGAIGEFGPIVAVAVVLTNRDPRLTFLLLVLFVAVAVVRRAPGHAGAPASPRRAPAPPPELDRHSCRSGSRSCWSPARVPGRQAQPRRAPRRLRRRRRRAPLHHRGRTARRSRASSRRSASASSSRSSSLRAASPSTCTR